MRVEPLAGSLVSTAIDNGARSYGAEKEEYDGACSNQADFPTRHSTRVPASQLSMAEHTKCQKCADDDESEDSKDDGDNVGCLHKLLSRVDCYSYWRLLSTSGC